jgi:ATP-dependent Lon protease
LQPGSPEYGVSRNYLDWATQVPWGRYGRDQLNVKRARQILDRDHEGLQEVKDRIVEFIALGAFRGSIGGTILLLVGPPGVGKTSIGKSVAEALNRPFYRFSVGGMRDEAEIKGHRRTYIGAMPGKFVQALKQVKVMNPVIMLDEIDKIGASYQGDPASALLETLDPEQNSSFLDHYLDVPVDLSQVVFIATANTLDTIPAPLLDRMEVIRLSGYLTEEKMAIARKHLWGRHLGKLRIMRSDLNITPTALRQVIEGYAREAGVRALDKQLARIIRKTVVKMVEDPKLTRVSIKPSDLTELLGEPRFKPEPPMVGVGVVTGLAWTAIGGATLSIEATRVPAKERGLKITGQLGEVMQESAQIAYSYVAGHAEELGIDPEFFMQANIHLHVPEGATPKDGPSAGITLASALMSLARDEAPKANVAMTGELTLTGQVLAIGGVREKLLAARRRGIETVILPSANRADFAGLPDDLKQGIEVHFVSRYSDVWPLLFKANPAGQSVQPNTRPSA